MQKFTVQKRGNLRDFTDEHYPQGSFALSRLLRAGDVRVNGVRVSKNVPLEAGDEVVYYTTAKDEERVFYREIYRDENILVVDKFAGGSIRRRSPNIFSAPAAPNLYTVWTETPAASCALRSTTKREKQLLAAFRERRAEKVYRAICFHPFRRKSAVCAAYLVKDERAARVKIFDEPVRGSEKILTEYRVLEDHGEYSLVEIRLHSGKTHQIRAHLAFLGNPVAGDEKYGGRSPQPEIPRKTADPRGKLPRLYAAGQAFLSQRQGVLLVLFRGSSVLNQDPRLYKIRF